MADGAQGVIDAEAAGDPGPARLGKLREQIERLEVQVPQAPEFIQPTRPCSPPITRRRASATSSRPSTRPWPGFVPTTRGSGSRGPFSSRRRATPPLLSWNCTASKKIYSIPVHHDLVMDESLPKNTSDQLITLLEEFGTKASGMSYARLAARKHLDARP